MIDQFHTIPKQNFIFFPTIIISSYTKKNVLAQSNHILKEKKTIGFEHKPPKDCFGLFNNFTIDCYLQPKTKTRLE
jgi:hypothetical protein